jgi:hypothetical protein
MMARSAWRLFCMVCVVSATTARAADSPAAADRSSVNTTSCRSPIRRTAPVASAARPLLACKAVNDNWSVTPDNADTTTTQFVPPCVRTMAAARNIADVVASAAPPNL